jgi:hypothetical protein
MNAAATLTTSHTTEGPGACGGMYTANTMASAIEALGMSVPYSSSIPAWDPALEDGKGGLHDEKIEECNRAVLSSSNFQPTFVAPKQNNLFLISHRFYRSQGEIGRCVIQQDLSRVDPFSYCCHHEFSLPLCCPFSYCCHHTSGLTTSIPL